MGDIAKGRYEDRNIETCLLEIGWYQKHTPDIVAAAVKRGFSKSEIQRWTGLSRSTILRYQRQVTRRGRYRRPC